MPNKAFVLSFRGNYQILTFASGESTLEFSPYRFEVCDPVLDLTRAIVDILRGSGHSTAIMIEAPGEYRVHMTREVGDVHVVIEWARDETTSVPTELLFEGDFDLRRLARDVAKGIKDSAAAGHKVSQPAIGSADLIHALLRGNAPSAWT